MLITGFNLFWQSVKPLHEISYPWYLFLQFSQSLCNSLVLLSTLCSLVLFDPLFIWCSCCTCTGFAITFWTQCSLFLSKTCLCSETICYPIFLIHDLSVLNPTYFIVLLAFQNNIRIFYSLVHTVIQHCFSSC